MQYLKALFFFGLLALAACGGTETETQSSGLSPAECTAAGGYAIWDLGTGAVIRNGCPDGQTLLGILPGLEGGICCSKT